MEKLGGIRTRKEGVRVFFSIVGYVLSADL